MCLVGITYFILTEKPSVPCAPVNKLPSYCSLIQTLFIKFRKVAISGQCYKKGLGPM